MTTTKRQFTWQELASLNKEHNAHIAVRGKVRKVQTLHNDQVLLSMNVHVAHLLVFKPKFKYVFRRPAGDPKLESASGDSNKL